jgi:dTDP-L-rhamnose 4-epimerase
MNGIERRGMESKLKAKRVLVTGGAGLIGSHLVDLLLREGHEVTVLDNLEPQTHPHGKPAWVPSEIRWIQGDLRNDADVKKALEGAQWVFHQAAFGGFSPALTQYMDVNASGTARLFEVIRAQRLSVEKIVVASSQAIYGEGLYQCATHDDLSPPMRRRDQLFQADWEMRCPHCQQPMSPLPTPEHAALNGETIYAISKMTEERLALSLGKWLDIPTVALRYAVTYGPRQSIFNPYTGVVSIFSTRLLNDKPPVIYEDGRQTRDFLFVEDNVRANLFVMQHPDTAYQAFNVGTGQPTHIDDLVAALAKIYGKSTLVPERSGGFRPGDVRHFTHDASKLKALGWSPTVRLEDGLARYVEWIASQSDIRDYFDEAQRLLNEMKVVINPVTSVFAAPT